MSVLNLENEQTILTIFFYCFSDFCLRDEIIALDNDESSSNFKTGLKSVLKCKQKFVEFLT